MKVTFFNTIRFRQLRQYILSVLCLGLLFGCASLRTASVSQPDIQWPPFPEKGRIVWGYQIKEPADSGIKKRWWQKITDWVAGASDETIGKPYGIHFDEMQRLYIVDPGRAVVHVFDPQKNRSYCIGRSQEGFGRFTTPIGVTTDGEGNVYVTDAGQGTVFRYHVDEERLEPFITAGLTRPTGIAYSHAQRALFVTDTTSHKITAFNREGLPVFSIGGHGDLPGYFNFPTDLFLDQKGQLYVTDALNHRVQVFTEKGRFIREFGAAGDGAGFFAKPKGIAVDSSGNIYVVDALLDAVQIFNPHGELLLTFGNHGSEPGSFMLPSGIYIDRKDTIYVSDSYNRRIQVFLPVNREAPYSGQVTMYTGEIR